MSDDQLDDGFRDRVKEVFENYEDDSADKGWLLLREKYPDRKRPDRAVFWWRFAGVAACMALLLYFYPLGRSKFVRQLKNTPVSTAQQTAVKQPVVSHTKPAGYAHIPERVQQRRSYAVLNPPTAASKTNLQVSVLHTPATVITTSSQPILRADSSSTAYESTVAALNNKTADTSHKKPGAAVNGSIMALFEKDAQTGNNKIVQRSTKNRVVFGIYAASYVNYAKGSRSQFNNGGGLSVDIRISDRLSINTGVLVAQNSLAFNGNTSGYAASAPAFYSINFPALSNLAPSSANQAVNLVNLDVPVNLTYQFNPQKGKIYLSAGLSSGTFINESYVTTYSYNLSQNNTEQLSQDGHHKSFDDFYLGQMLNLAFGLGYPLGRNKLVIEPFFKYPLGGLGDQHILFGSGGLNLKFNLGPPVIRK